MIFFPSYITTLHRRKKKSHYGLILWAYSVWLQWNLITGSLPDVTCLWPVAETPSVSSEILPAYVTRVMPQGAHLKEKDQKRLKHSSLWRLTFHSTRNCLKGTELTCIWRRGSREFSPRYLWFTVCLSVTIEQREDKERRALFEVAEATWGFKGDLLARAHSLLLFPTKGPSTLPSRLCGFLPGQGCFLCATEHSAGARQALWWNSQPLQTGLNIPEPLWGWCPSRTG